MIVSVEFITSGDGSIGEAPGSVYTGGVVRPDTPGASCVLTHRGRRAS